MGVGGRLYFSCPDVAEARGGVRIIYRHVDHLNGAGIEAWVMHEGEGFKARWFEHSTKVMHRAAVAREAERGDVVVLPEIVAPQGCEVIPQAKKVVFNQNAYYTFVKEPHDLRDARSLYTHPDVLCAVVESEDSRQYLQWAFPKLIVHRVKVSVDERLFHPNEAKRKVVALMPRKQGMVAQQVLRILRHRGALEGWAVRVIDGKTEEQTAALLRESAVFLSFGHPEGFGLPAAEGMACGCVVVGYHGNGGREFFTPEHGFPVEAGDVVEFARRAEEVLRRLKGGERFEEMRERASKFILTTYSVEEERRSVVECWRGILKAARV